MQRKIHLASLADGSFGLQSNTTEMESPSHDHNDSILVGNVPFTRYAQMGSNYNALRNKKHVLNIIADQHQRLQSEGFDVKGYRIQNSTLQDKDVNSIRFLSNQHATTSRNVGVARKIQFDHQEKLFHQESNYTSEDISQISTQHNASKNISTAKKIDQIRQDMRHTGENKNIAEKVNVSKYRHTQNTRSIGTARKTHQAPQVEQFSGKNKHTSTYETVNRNIMKSKHGSVQSREGNKNIRSVVAGDSYFLNWDDIPSAMDNVQPISEQQHFEDYSNDLNRLKSSLHKLETLLDELGHEGSCHQSNIHQLRQQAIRRFRIWKGMRSQKAGFDCTNSGSLFDSSEVLLAAESFGRRLSEEERQQQPIASTDQFGETEKSKPQMCDKLKFIDKDISSTSDYASKNESSVLPVDHVSASAYLDETIFGEVAFQLERRVLAYIFHGHAQSLLYGYSLRNIELMIRTQAGEQREILQRRCDQVGL